MQIAQRLAILACCLVALLTGCSGIRSVGSSVPAPARSMTAPADVVPAELPAANPVLVTIDGSVQSPDGRPLPGVRLSIRPASSTRECLTCAGLLTRTDSAGRFTVTLARADYLIMCAFADASACRVEGRVGPAAFAVTSGSRDLVVVAARAPAAGRTVTLAPRGPGPQTSDAAPSAMVELQLSGSRPGN